MSVFAQNMIWAALGAVPPIGAALWALWAGRRSGMESPLAAPLGMIVVMVAIIGTAFAMMAVAREQIMIMTEGASVDELSFAWLVEAIFTLALLLIGWLRRRVPAT